MANIGRAQKPHLANLLAHNIFSIFSYAAHLDALKSLVSNKILPGYAAKLNQNKLFVASFAGKIGSVPVSTQDVLSILEMASHENDDDSSAKLYAFYKKNVYLNNFTLSLMNKELRIYCMSNLEEGHSSMGIKRAWCES